MSAGGGPTRAYEPALDGLRGLASLVVVLRHSFNAMVLPPALRMDLAQSPLAVLLNAQGAVQLFFVLSGWVLAGSLERSGERAPWPQFFVRRVLRIHPPYVFGVLFAIAVATWATIPPGLTPHPPPSLPDGLALAGHLAFPSHVGNLLPIAWTLRIELLFSFLMPLLLIAAAPARGALLIAASVVLLFASPWELPRYALDFALGVVAHRERAAIGAFFERIGAALRGVVAMAGLLLWVSPLFVATVRVLRSEGVSRSYLLAGFAPLEIAAMGAGAVLLVASAVHVAALRRALGAAPFLFLGRISYSLYLLHWAVLTCFAPRLVDGSTRGNLALLLVVVPVSIAISVPVYRWVERPSIALGNRLCRRIARRLGTAPVESHAAQT